jgi:hypothetical protein
MSYRIDSVASYPPPRAHGPPQRLAPRNNVGAHTQLFTELPANCNRFHEITRS